MIIIVGAIFCFRARRKDHKSGPPDLDIIPPHTEMRHRPQAILESLNADGDMPSGMLRVSENAKRDMPQGSYGIRMLKFGTLEGWKIRIELCILGLYVTRSCICIRFDKSLYGMIHCIMFTKDERQKILVSNFQLFFRLRLCRNISRNGILFYSFDCIFRGR